MKISQNKNVKTLSYRKQSKDAKKIIATIPDKNVGNPVS